MGMETRLDTGSLAIELARERTEMKRERIDLGGIEGLGRQVMMTLGSWASSMDRVFKTPLEQSTFCDYHPAECRGIS
jgi:hypothetical protein